MIERLLPLAMGVLAPELIVMLCVLMFVKTIPAAIIPFLADLSICVACFMAIANSGLGFSHPLSVFMVGYGIAYLFICSFI